MGNTTPIVLSSLLSGPLEFGQIIVISGQTKRICDRVNIDLIDGTGVNSYLHISARFPENLVVRNTRFNNMYGIEERSFGYKGVKNPFSAGGDFHFYIAMGFDQFHIALNNSHYCDFKYRDVVNKVTAIQIAGEVESISQVDHRRTFPYPHPLVQTRNLKNSFSSDIPIKPIAGLVSVIKASPHGNAQGNFTVRFMVGTSGLQALHFDVRFGQLKVARNHTCNDKKDFDPKVEESTGGFPFQYNRVFKIAFAFGTDRFKIAVDGKHYCDFLYKASLDKMSGAKIAEANGLILKISEFNYFTVDKSLKNYETLSKI